LEAAGLVGAADGAALDVSDDGGAPGRSQADKPSRLMTQSKPIIARHRRPGPDPPVAFASFRIVG
ncbi:MAG: hypothetical protein LBV30_06695, partial [Propionibacteriaceae bacterium]|nr:hypothetical protein [Propionibacteriaceae bacterium]